ncbi:MAG: nucleotidyltransferase domain-containing protein [Spirochaetales bacterium]|nr:nucleotidyltransferase domain-containing protein [Spirochaetales bacterium]
MENIQGVLLKIRQILSMNSDVKKVILFGSYSDGTATADSDLDLCILTDSDIRKIDLLRKIRRELYDFVSIPLDLLVYSFDEFYERSSSLSSIEKEIEENGVSIYE